MNLKTAIFISFVWTAVMPFVYSAEKSKTASVPATLSVKSSKTELKKKEKSPQQKRAALVQLKFKTAKAAFENKHYGSASDITFEILQLDSKHEGARDLYQKSWNRLITRHMTRNDAETNEKPAAVVQRNDVPASKSAPRDYLKVNSKSNATRRTGEPSNSARFSIVQIVLSWVTPDRNYVLKSRHSESNSRL